MSKPAYFIAVLHSQKAIVIALKGTSTRQDMLVDMTHTAESFMGGYAHYGMLRAAMMIDQEERGLVMELLKQNQGYSLVLTGHSLGGGVVCLLSMIWRQKLVESNGHSGDGSGLSVLGVHPDMISCWSFATPACVSYDIAVREEYIHSIILQDDIVPRLCAAAVEQVRREVHSHSLSGSSQNPTQINRAIQVARQVVKPVLGRVASTAGNAGRKIGLSPTAIRAVTTGPVSKYAKALASATVFGFAAASQERGKNGSVKNVMTKFHQGAKIGASVFLNRGSSTRSADPAGRGEPSEEDQVVASALRQSIYARPGDPDSFRQMVAPGTLYHILRMPWDDYNGGGGGGAPYRHVIMKAQNRHDRFTKIVLSKRMILDHRRRSYRAAIDDVLFSLESPRSQAGAYGEGAS
ncbi:hypothetical protein CBR_g36895 [Chara braunii]|uniref:Fungal lipase-type domain-containing protein n=1 Tax=Chara braunii TaxID=69332 RepID=A0A388LLS5_CHABU|nr:hypothetical protein CBR_g36895 [Chara braunii]|eukprot:GBG83280.1 hypothetical protein CBR_g36895 [Chara braunii]